MKAFKQHKIAVIGAGLGGTAIAILLQKRGYQVDVYEQAPSFKKLGAGIHLSPNLVKVLAEIGVKDELTTRGAAPSVWVSKSLSDNRLLFALPLGDEAESSYGSPYLTVNRGEFHASMFDKINPEHMHLNKRLETIESHSHGNTLNFSDGSSAYADIIIGADGIKSRVRANFMGEEPLLFGNQVAYRGQTPIAKLSYPQRYELSKWWDETRFVITYFMESDPDVVYFVAGHPCAEWAHGEAFVPATQQQIIESFNDDVCDPVKELIKHSEKLSLWPIYEREPNNCWGAGNIILLGDACHPMRPHMAQGAAMAIEDAAIIARLFDSPYIDNIGALREIYLSLRFSRTAKVQQISSANVWLKEPTNPDWLYGYDAMTCDLSAA